MSILEEIQTAAIDSNGDLGTVLRKCKVLAARLGSGPLENWLLWESNGYPGDVEVPEYRTWPLQLRGHFSGYWGAAIQDAPIPLIVIPEDIRGQYEKYECRQSISGIESTLSAAKSGDSGKCTVSTSDLAVLLGGTVYENYNCLQAWGEFGNGHLFELLNAVRNRILDFTLAIWKQAPTAGELNGQASGKIEAAQVTQIFQTTVYGPATVLGTAQNSPISLNVVTNNFDSLRSALKERGVSSEDIQELETAVAGDAKPTAQGKFGPRVSSWMGKMVKKAAEGAWDASVTIAGKVLSEAITTYYGLH